MDNLGADMSDLRIRPPNLTRRWNKPGDHAGIEAYTPAKGEEKAVCDDCGHVLGDHGSVTGLDAASRVCPGDLIIGGGALRAWPFKDIKRTTTAALEA